MRSTRKELKALATGADYATKAAGATSVGLSALGLCGVMISNPIALGIAGIIGAIFCCAGICSECNQPDHQETDLEHKIDDIENKLDEVIDHRLHYPRRHSQQPAGSVRGEVKSSPTALRRSASEASSLRRTLFCCYSGINPVVVRTGPERMTMDKEGEKKGNVQRVR